MRHFGVKNGFKPAASTFVGGNKDICTAARADFVRVAKT